MICHECGAKTSKGASACKECGASLEKEQVALQEDEGRPRWMRRAIEVRWIIIVYLAVSVVCMSSCCLLGYRLNWILWTLGLR